MSTKEIHVYFHHLLTEELPSLGTLSVSQTRGKEFFAFQFNSEFLKRSPRILLDPDLQFYPGPQYTSKANFGIFMDSAPDRWGRKLMQRREALLAKNEGRAVRKLLESDYLLDVYDETRMGAIRFKLPPDDAYQNQHATLPTPPWTKLRELEEACRRLDSDVSLTDEDRWLSLLLAPGSSLGGARPKATVCDPKGALWIAKFPAKNDEVNVAVWEYLTMQMARDAGLRVAECRLERFSKYGSTFLTKRFDRNLQQRVHFASAMTLLGKVDGNHADSGATYLELAEFISQYGVNPDVDLKELWRRIVFSIAVSNTDDHLRNHGFLFTPNGWNLSPVYDLNPNPDGYGLSLNISEESNALDFDLALEVASAFRLSPNEANRILNEVRGIVSNVKTYAKALQIPSSEQARFAPAFNF